MTTAIRSLFVQARESAQLCWSTSRINRAVPPRCRRLYERERAALCATARLLGTELVNVALLAGASDAPNALANSIKWKPGDEVVTADLEFPSGVLTWLRLWERGVRVRVTRSRGGALLPIDFAAAISPATGVVCVSHVSYKTGTRIPFCANFPILRIAVTNSPNAGSIQTRVVVRAFPGDWSEPDSLK